MHEAFLHHVWQFQYFSKRQLTTTDGEPLQVFKPGLVNHHAGPDFQDAKVRIGQIDWAGMVEIHVKASDWYAHQHHHDAAYENVVLHVVWEANREVRRNDGSTVPTLELKQRVDEKLIHSYRRLVGSGSDIPCGDSFARVEPLVVHAMLDRSMTERLQRKSDEVLALLRENNGDWEETTYQLIAKYFGFKVNNEPFFRLAKAIPYKILMKHRDHPRQVEALLFGQAGFLDAVGGGEYPTLLKREYRLLSAKYQLQDKKLDPGEWKFLRLRPANFPTVRLAQLCALVGGQPGLFSRIAGTINPARLRMLFQVTQSDYWLSHYHFGTRAQTRVASLGKSSVDILCVNVIAPILVALGKSRDDQEPVDRAIQLLESLPSESNQVTRNWSDVGYTAKNAFDSQALLELYQRYCSERSCLSCTIGAALLKPSA